MGAGKRQSQESSLLNETNFVSECHKGLNRGSAAAIRGLCACSSAQNLFAPLGSLTDSVTTEQISVYYTACSSDMQSFQVM